MSFIADTDVLIDFLRNRGDEAKRIELELKTGRLCTTVASAFELWVGAKSQKEKAAVGTLLNASRLSHSTPQPQISPERFFEISN